ncbi:MAG: phytanoyl-CoA dioxygenase family protein, partial [Flavobacteriales bacterium]
QEVDRLVNQKIARWKGDRKIMFAIKDSQKLKNLANPVRLMNILEMLMGKELKLFQSINFLQGSEQRAHSDTIHMTTYPLGNLIAVWIALEDVDEENGTLHYYPGSHKLPYITNKDIGNEGTKWKLGDKPYSAYEDKIEEVIEENNLKKETLKAQKGDIFIWHANLLHGGEPHKDPSRTRKSMVLHYFSKDAICYHEITQRPTLFSDSI